MTTITKEFTKEQLIAKAREQIAFCRDTKITGEGRAHVNQCSALFEIALAALTAEPAKCGNVNMDCDDGKAVCLSCGKVWEV
ncbi:TPA: hypothetical protein ACIBXF_002491 [Salmonella enterica subsp. enterica serovar Mississippi]|uniref:hypothetical protein n=1 Tax=Salmonella enterica TaxID=28901 RepID=UPI001EE953E7|nr:hypothetical protein [Salmonella enterica]HEC6392612.1 hypothetical protein [Salmonella enterica subsp. enterica serovar Warragul]HEC7039915.1 hypothetical protein [Salmonella enterica subsp. enterica serovar Mississippi]HEC7950248.1 hypothetical protein [Salmonella enterica subsp. enterica serovar Orientalis]ULA44332.1 hypothetical protein MC377_08795 [Salmonella enterica]UNN13532.1 hypothetical protein MOV20_08795 [Salmonella enterica]